MFRARAGSRPVPRASVIRAPAWAERPSRRGRVGAVSHRLLRLRLARFRVVSLCRSRGDGRRGDRDQQHQRPDHAASRRGAVPLLIAWIPFWPAALAARRTSRSAAQKSRPGNPGRPQRCSEADVGSRSRGNHVLAVGADMVVAAAAVDRSRLIRSSSLDQVVAGPPLIRHCRHHRSGCRHRPRPRCCRPPWSPWML